MSAPAITAATTPSSRTAACPRSSRIDRKPLTRVGERGDRAGERAERVAAGEGKPCAKPALPHPDVWELAPVPGLDRPVEHHERRQAAAPQRLGGDARE